MGVGVGVGEGGAFKEMYRTETLCEGLMSERLQLSVPSRVLCVDAATYIACTEGSH